MPPTFGAELTAQGTVPAACEPHFQAASMGGRAAWPTVRHLAVQWSGAGPRCVATPATASWGLGSRIVAGKRGHPAASERSEGA